MARKTGKTTPATKAKARAIRHREAMPKRGPKKTAHHLDKIERQDIAVELFTEGLSHHDVAKRLNVTTATVSNWLNEPQFLKRLETARKAIMSGERIRNIRALVDVRDNTEFGQQRVNAVRVLEELVRKDAEAEGPATKGDGFVPGLVIVLPSMPSQAPDQRYTIEANALRLHGDIPAPQSERPVFVDLAPSGEGHGASDGADRAGDDRNAEGGVGVDREDGERGVG